MGDGVDLAPHRQLGMPPVALVDRYIGHVTGTDIELCGGFPAVVIGVMALRQGFEEVDAFANELWR